MRVSDRQSFLGGNSDRILFDSTVGVVGLGGGGAHVVQQLAHVGVGKLVLCDPDRVEITNLNRLVGATHSDAMYSARKTEVARRLVGGVNPNCFVRAFAIPWQKAEIHLRSCDVLVGCVDSYLERMQLEQFSRRYLIPYIDIGMEVTELDDKTYALSGQVISSIPGRLCMWCLGFLRQELIEIEAGEYGAAGGRPQVVWSNGVLASIAAGIVVKALTPWHPSDVAPLLEFDGNANTIQPSNKLRYLKNVACNHYSHITHLGDPWWIPEVVDQSPPVQPSSSFIAIA